MIQAAFVVVVVVASIIIIIIIGWLLFFKFPFLFFANAIIFAFQCICFQAHFVQSQFSIEFVCATRCARVSLGFPSSFYFWMLYACVCTFFRFDYSNLLMVHLIIVRNVQVNAVKDERVMDMNIKNVVSIDIF